MSARSDGVQANGASRFPSISADGRFVEFESGADNLAPASNGATNVYVKEPGGVASKPVVADAFARSVTGGWGSAPIGGPYTLSGGSSSFSVGGYEGKIVSSKAGVGRSAVLRDVSLRDSTAVVSFFGDKAPKGGSHQVWLSARDTAGGRYRAVVKLRTDRSVALSLTRTVGSVTTVLARMTIPDLRYEPFYRLYLRMQVSGGTTTVLRASVWDDAEPSVWQLTGTDTRAITTEGGIGVGTYISSATNLPVTHTFDDLTVTRLPSAPPVS